MQEVDSVAIIRRIPEENNILLIIFPPLNLIILLLEVNNWIINKIIQFVYGILIDITAFVNIYDNPFKHETCIVCRLGIK
jgi:hypothetical protein